MMGPDDRVLVAVSGGADSIALLHVLQALGYPVAVAHLDHGTRDGASNDDADFVEGVARALGAPLHRSRWDGVRAPGESFEMAARAARYAFFQQCAQEHGYNVIATAHHADDQAETVLMRLTRGVSPRGLAGIPHVYRGGAKDVRLVRPLLDATRGEIRNWLRDNSLIWREDATNADTTIPRNRIRHETLPLLRDSVNAKVDDALRRAASIHAIENAYLDGEAEALLARCSASPDSVDRNALREAPKALRLRALVRWAEHRGVSLNYHRVLAADDFVAAAPNGNAFDLGDGFTLHAGRDRIECLGPERPTGWGPYPLSVPGERDAGAWRVSIRFLPTPPATPVSRYCTARRQVFDADRLGDSLALRTRRDGDRFRPLGRGGGTKLKAYLLERGIPAPLRDAVPLLIAGNEIAWVVGYDPAESVAVHADTRRLVEVELHDATQ